MKKSNITLKAYYYHEESDSIFIAELGHSSPEFDFIKIGLAINPSTKDLKLKVEKRFLEYLVVCPVESQITATIKDLCTSTPQAF